MNQGDVGTFNALSATLNTNYGEQIRDVRMRQIDIARQYFKTLFMQSALASLSRILLYVGVPAELISTVMLVATAGPSAQAFYASMPPLLIAATVAVGFAPLAVLFAFALRIATVAQRTAAITPFTTHERKPS